MKLEDVEKAAGFKSRLDIAQKQLRDFTNLESRNIKIESTYYKAEFCCVSIPVDSEHWLALKALAVTFLAEEITNIKDQMRELGVES